MKATAKHNERIAKMTFASVYPHYVNKVEKKGRTKEELHQVIEWLTGYDELRLQDFIDKKETFETFFQTVIICLEVCVLPLVGQAEQKCTFLFPGGGIRPPPPPLS